MERVHNKLKSRYNFVETDKWKGYGPLWLKRYDNFVIIVKLINPDSAHFYEYKFDTFIVDSIEFNICNPLYYEDLNPLYKNISSWHLMRMLDTFDALEVVQKIRQEDSQLG